jgi:hypothetical protein
MGVEGPSEGEMTAIDHCILIIDKIVDCFDVSSFFTYLCPKLKT